MAMLLDAREAAALVERPRSTIRSWVREGWLNPVARDPSTRSHLFRRGDVFRCERDARRRRGRPRKDQADEVVGVSPV